MNISRSKQFKKHKSNNRMIKLINQINKVIKK
jgi:hypothetical protein